MKTQDIEHAVHIDGSQSLKGRCLAHLLPSEHPKTRLDALGVQFLKSGL